MMFLHSTADASIASGPVAVDALAGTMARESPAGLQDHRHQVLRDDARDGAQQQHEGVAEASAAPDDGAPAARGRSEYRCRTCRLSKQAPDIVELIHRLAAQGLGGRAILTRIAPILLARRLRPPSHDSVDRHIELHAALDRTTPSDGASAAPSAPPAGDQRDSARLEDLLDRVFAKLELLEQDPTAFIGVDGRVDLARLAQWSSMINAARQILDSNARARSSDRYVVMFAQEVVRAIVTRFRQAAMTELQDAYLLAVDTGADRVADRIESAVKRTLGEVFLKAATDVLLEQIQEHRLAIPAWEATRRLA